MQRLFPLTADIIIYISINTVIYYRCSIDGQMDDSDYRIFSETQRMTLWWVWFIVLIPAGVAWYAFIEQIIFGKPFGNNPAPDFVVWIIFLLVGIGFPLIIYSSKLTTYIDRRMIYVRFAPLATRRIELKDIQSCRVRKYRPILEYGGWGIRYSFKHGRALNISGNMGVQLELKNGKKLLIGSQKPHELQQAIEQVMRMQFT